MGRRKKTTTSGLQNPSSTSNSRKSLHINMNHTKKRNKLKRLRQKHKMSIQKLFYSLRNEATGISLDQSVVSIVDDDTLKSQENASPNQTVICLDDTDSPKNILKRKGSFSPESVELKRNKIIIIADKDSEESLVNREHCKIDVDTPKKNAQSLHCSTPLANHNNRDLSNLNISNLSNDKTVCNQNQEIININKEIEDLTKEINNDSYITIDLTTETLDKTGNSVEGTVIDLDKETNECLFVSNSTDSLSMSGDSNITVLPRSQVNRKDKNLKQVAAAFTKLLNSGEKGKLMELIAQNIFKGCNVQIPEKNPSNQCLDTAEDTFIKEVILGKTQSRNSIGSNIYNPEKEIKAKSGLRMIVIDGSNVAMEHGQHKSFSVKGLKTCIEYFVKRGHIVKAFVPRFRCKFGKSSDPRLLDALERQGLVVYTPSREVQGKFITPYDDRYIVQCAAEFDGVIVSGDNYRDLLHENPRWRFIIENRLLPFTWVNDMIMFPRDPLGRNGPTLEAFLRHSSNS